MQRLHLQRAARLALTPWLKGLGLLALAALFGAISVLYGNTFNTRPNFLLALPLTLALLFCFVLSRHLLLMTVLFLRAPLDPLLETTRLQLGPVPVGLGGILNALILLLVVSLVFDRRKPPFAPGLRLWGPLLAVYAVGCLIAPEKGDAVRIFLALLTYPAAFLAGARGPHQLPDFDRAVRFVLASVVVVNLYVLIGMASHEHFYPVYLQSHDAGQRLTGPFTHPNILAFYLVLALALALYALHERARSPGRASQATAGFVLLSSLVLLILTKTRSAWIAAYVMGVLYAGFANRKALPLIVLAPLLLAFVPEVRERVADVQSGNEMHQFAKLNSYAWRKLMWQSALEWMSPSRYLLGYGLDTFRTHSPTFFPLAGRTGFGAHNIYVQTFFESGLAGLAALLWLMTGLARAYWRMARGAARHLLIFLIAMYLIVGYSDNMLNYLVLNITLFYVLGAGWALTLSQATLPQATRLRRHPPPWQLRPAHG